MKLGNNFTCVLSILKYYFFEPLRITHYYLLTTDAHSYESGAFSTFRTPVRPFRLLGKGNGASVREGNGIPDMHLAFVVA